MLRPKFNNLSRGCGIAEGAPSPETPGGDETLLGSKFFDISSCLHGTWDLWNKQNSTLGHIPNKAPMLIAIVDCREE